MKTNDGTSKPVENYDQSNPKPTLDNARDALDNYINLNIPMDYWIIKGLTAAIEAYCNEQARATEDRIIQLCQRKCPQHDCEMTPVRSVTGVVTTYCSLDRVVLSGAALTKQSKS